MFKRLVFSLCTLAPSLFIAAPMIHADDVHCSFTMGFADIAAMMPNEVGACLTPPEGLGTGDVAQQTTRGQPLWTKGDNVPRFIEGATTWLLGPFRLQQRATDQRLSWEAPSATVAGVTITNQPPPQNAR